ncbi:MAG: threonine-phosphate decarboxylase [Candidatus Schekmanbacteria bacterium]|nr:threonine-phosphate decarboxylase [Candidatus Schekmanbacteria bacterium]
METQKREANPNFFSVFRLFSVSVVFIVSDKGKNQMPDLHGGNRRRIMEEYHLTQLIDFSVNLNPLGPPPQLIEAVCSNINLIEEYPPEKPCRLEEMLAAGCGLFPENILVGNGSTEIIYLIPHLSGSGCGVVVTPAFSEYERACIAARRAVIFWPMEIDNGFACDWKGLFKEHGKKMGCLFIANPGNPAGNLLPKDQLLYLLEQAQEYDFLLVLDEAFLEFVEDSRALTLISQVRGNPHLLVLRSITKFYAIPGLRLGYVAGNSQIIQSLKKLQPPWSVNYLSQTAGEAILTLDDYEESTRKLVSAQRELIYRALSQHPWFAPYPSAANYHMVKITKSGLTADKLQMDLIRRGFLIRNCTNFRGLTDQHFRLAVRTPYENQALLAVLNSL